MHVGMMISGRFLAGVACGQLLAVVPAYIAEISPPGQRGFLVGLQGMMVAIGFALANWVGYSGSFAAGSASWRIPLAMQIPIPLLLMGLVFLIPFTPRWRKFLPQLQTARQLTVRQWCNKNAMKRLKQVSRSHVNL